MTRRRTRRALLRRAALGTTAVAATSVAGCTGLLSGGTATDTGNGETGDSTDPLDWLYDPTTDADQSTYDATLRSPSRMARASQYTHDSLDGDADTGMSSLPPRKTDWVVTCGDRLQKAPVLFAAGGSFDESTASEDGFLFASGAEWTDAGRTAGYRVVRFEEGSFGAYRTGRVVAAMRTTEAQFREMLRTFDAGEEGLTAAEGGVGTLVSTVGFEEVSSFSLERDEDSTWHGYGYNYDIKGAETRFRVADLRWGEGVEGPREMLADIDGLRDVEAGENGDVAWAAATGDTDRFGFQGHAITLGELPHDGSSV